jgi:hypothetical protein
MALIFMQVEVSAVLVGKKKWSENAKYMTWKYTRPSYAQIL